MELSMGTDEDYDHETRPVLFQLHCYIETWFGIGDFGFVLPENGAQLLVATTELDRAARSWHLAPYASPTNKAFSLSYAVRDHSRRPRVVSSTAPGRPRDWRRRRAPGSRSVQSSPWPWCE